jgi:hypothetical protein
MPKPTGPTNPIIASLIEPRRLLAENCKIIKPLEIDQKTPKKNRG